MSEQGEVYAAYIEGEMKAERDRRTALDARGLAIVTTSGTLTTLLAAVGAFVSGRQGFKLPDESVPPLVVTLSSFVVAAVLGIIANQGRKHQVSTPKTLAAMLTSHWTDHPVDARNAVSIQNVKTITSLRIGNNRKERWVFAGTLFQILGLAALSVAVFLILRTAA